ncbi:MAG: hypothetical protein FJ395_04355 [Verrucomicrobia bacterium]|nr:hypothetical protein [Verrucomicrobiota bacterium]
MKCRIIVTAIAVALIASVSAFAAKGEGKAKGAGGLLPPPIVEKLSAEQKTKYEALCEKAKGAKGDEAKMNELKKEARALLTPEQKAEMQKAGAGKGKGGKKK